MTDLRARRGTVVGVPGNGRIVVNIGTGNVTALLCDATAGVQVGASVTLIPIDGSYEAISARSVGGSSGANYGPELVPNGSFEFLDGEGLPAGWQVLWDFTKPQPHGSSTSSPVEGARNMVVRARSAAAHDVIMWVPAFRVDVSTRYRVDMWARVEGTPPASLNFVHGAITAKTQTAAAPLATGSNARALGTQKLTVANTLYTGEFTTTSTEKWATPYIRSESSTRGDFEVYIDAVSLRRRIN